MPRISPLPAANGLGPLPPLHRAAILHQQGRFSEAEQFYRVALNANRRDFECLCRFGVLRLQQSRFDDAVRLFREALRENRKSAEVHQYLGFALTGADKAEDAVPHFERALALKPGFAEAHNNFGYALQKLNRLEEAVVQFRKAVALMPGYPEALNNLGNALHLLGQHQEAIATYEQAIAARPNYAEAYWNIGNAFRGMGRLEEAIPWYEKALHVRSNYPEALNALGNTLRTLGRHEEALVAYQKAIAINPGYVDGRINLGDLLALLKREQEAIAQFDQALLLRPNDPQALTKRGEALSMAKRLTEAIANFEQVLATNPDMSVAFDGVLNCAGAACDWNRTAKYGLAAQRRVRNGGAVAPFLFLGHCADPELQLACARNYINKLSAADKFWRGAIWKNEKIKLAYLSCGFHRHPTAHLTAELIEIHDRSQFDVLGLSVGPDDQSDIRNRLIKAFDEFHDLRHATDSEVAHLISEKQIDILVDRSGYTMNSRPEIFAHRPAPIQVSYIGYPGTLGADFYDYVLADRIVAPFDHQPMYTEQIVHLPDSYLVTDSTMRIAERTPTRQELGLPEQAFVFCCFNNNYKVTAPVFDIWMSLMARVEGSVLWLLRDNVDAEHNLRREAAARGIDPSRLVFAARVPLHEHLARHRQADLFLDTLPYNAHTTAVDALWTELPVVTCCGASFAGRVAASLLHAISLPELVTRSLADYESLALRLATEPSFLEHIRQKLKQNRLTQPLFDTRGYRRHIEAAYRRMWEIWQSGEAPRGFAIERIAD